MKNRRESLNVLPEKEKDKDFEYVKRLLPYILQYKTRTLAAICLLIMAKFATVAIPMLLKEIVDILEKEQGMALAIPFGFLLIYGSLRFANSMFQELQKVIFTRVRYGIMRRISIELLSHLHSLSLRFHLERKTGALTRDIDRGTNSVSNLLNYLLFNIVPTFVEVALVSTILFTQYDYRFAVISVVTLALYISWTFFVTSWRMKFRRAMNQKNSAASSRAIDSLLNYETVKYFGNEGYEIEKYDNNLTEWEKVATRAQLSLSVLNGGQALLIAVGVTATMIIAADEVSQGTMTIGDLVAVNAYLLQLFIPLGFLGTVYSILKNAVSDMERMFAILDRRPEIEDKIGAVKLNINKPSIQFKGVDFSYEENRQILFDVSFEIPSGHSLAVVGASGSGKSTLGRLLYRFYDVQKGSVNIDGNDVKNVTQASLRSIIGTVPQDTVLFNDTLYMNIMYGRLGSTKEEVEKAAESANLTSFINSLPDGYETIVGERGLKLSGGEKQRVAIARAILKNPPIVIFDEATSSLDSESERAIMDAIKNVSTDRTTLTIAHRLSTIVDSDQIIVLDAGRIVERGTHRELLELEGRYAELWMLQQADSSSPPPKD